MKSCFYESCRDAVQAAGKEQGYGVYYSDRQEPDQQLHIHECCEVLLCLSGGKTFLIDGQVYDVQDRDLFVINQFEVHKITFDPHCYFVRYILQVNPTFLYAHSTENTRLTQCFFGREEGAPAKISLTEDACQQLVSLFEQLKEERAYGGDLYQKMTVMEILIEINRLFATHLEGWAGEEGHRTIQAAIDYINENYAKPLTLQSVAKQVYISVNQLGRLFNRYGGTTVSRYIVSKRITEAKKRLLAGLSITDTAYQCGFKDYANFIRVFKKHVGLPPGQYSRQSRPAK
ncbi:MAG: AraC family transcriptional regulator [Eubacteriales bacterium]